MQVGTVGGPAWVGKDMRGKNRNLLIILTGVVVVVLGFSLAFLRRAGKDGLGTVNPAPSGEPSGSLSVGVENDFGFGQTLLAPPKTVEVKERVRFPRRVKVYPILPAPFEYFSVEAVQGIAQKLGFTATATATRKNRVYLYREGKKTLIVNPQAGTIWFSVASSPAASSLPAGIDVNQARTKVKTLLSELNLNLPLVNWEGALLDEKGILKPRLEVAGLPLIPPIEDYARFDSKGDLVGLSYWLPNLDYQNVEEVAIIGLEDARQKIKSGRAIVVRGDPRSLDTQSFERVSLQYLVRPEVIYNPFPVPELLPVYVFENDEITLYVNAIDK